MGCCIVAIIVCSVNDVAVALGRRANCDGRSALVDTESRDPVLDIWKRIVTATTFIVEEVPCLAAVPVTTTI
ncbi:hypothetical protein E2C01_027904 [Portunus trituberculatus]|uniref:Secreted protein n=1 Tax=Portunus trituberculatus TaxID=210409 RepID=A0A5B7EJW9_PORTR|nr:hypothetical protein [Portunus trituberculatus]